MDNRFSLGLDVSKRTVDVCLLESNGRTQRTRIANSQAGFQQLMSWLHGIDAQQIHACLEPTGKYSRAIALFLLANAFLVSQVNSFAVLSHGRSKNFRSKNDTIDAYLLADYCLKEKPPAWVPVEQSRLELRSIEARIADIGEMLRQEQNRLEAGIDSTLVRQEIEEHIAYLTVRKKQLEKAAKEAAHADPVLAQDYAIVKSIVGLGERSTLTLLAYIRFNSFEQARDAGCFAGLTPRQYRSGTSVFKRDKISRMGNRSLRKLLFFPAMVAIQHNPQMRAFSERLRAAGKPPKVVICAVMRKLLVLATTLVLKQEFYDPAKGLPALS